MFQYGNPLAERNEDVDQVIAKAMSEKKSAKK
jgi:hypothetical protein